METKYKEIGTMRIEKKKLLTGWEVVHVLREANEVADGLAKANEVAAIILPCLIPCSVLLGWCP